MAWRDLCKCWWRRKYYPFPGVCGFLIDNTGSLLLTTHKLQKVAGDIYFCRGYQKMQKFLRYLRNWDQRVLSGGEFSLFAENITVHHWMSHGTTTNSRAFLILKLEHFTRKSSQPVTRRMSLSTNWQIFMQGAFLYLWNVVELLKCCLSMEE